MKLENGRVILESLEAQGFKYLTDETYPDMGVPPGELRERVSRVYAERMAQEPGKFFLWNLAKHMLEGLDRLAALN